MKNSTIKNKNNKIFWVVAVGVVAFFLVALVLDSVLTGGYFKFVDGDYGDYCVAIAYNNTHRCVEIQGHLGDPNKDEDPFLVTAHDQTGDDKFKVNIIWLPDCNGAEAALYDGKIDELTDVNNLETMYAHVLEHGKKRL